MVLNGPLTSLKLVYETNIYVYIYIGNSSLFIYYMQFIIYIHTITYIYIYIFFHLISFHLCIRGNVATLCWMGLQVSASEGLPKRGGAAVLAQQQ